MLVLLALDGWMNESISRVVASLLVVVATTAGSFIFGRYWGRRNAVRQWNNKEFLGRINVSLNLFNDGRLKIRTLIERDVETVFQNQIAIESIEKAVKGTTLANPLLPIESKDRWYLLNYVLNAVSEHFVSGLIKQDANVPVVTVNYVLFLTCELVGDERVRKIRALIIRKDLIETFPYLDSMPVLEREWHNTRIETLRIASRIYHETPDLFIHLELSV